MDCLQLVLSTDVDSNLQKIVDFFTKLNEGTTSKYEDLSTKYDALRAKYDLILDECKKLRINNEKLESDVILMGWSVNDLEQNCLEDNIIFNGIPEVESSKSETDIIAQDVLNNILSSFEKKSIIPVKIIGPADENNNSAKLRPVITKKPGLEF